MRMCELKKVFMAASFLYCLHIQVDKLTFAIIPATPPQSIRRVRSVALFAAVLFSFPIAFYNIWYRQVMQRYQMDVAPLNLFAF